MFNNAQMIPFQVVSLKTVRTRCWIKETIW